MFIKKVSFLTCLMICGFAAQAQEYNPFEPIGKKGKIITLSNGKYVETFDMDTIQRIGSVFINLRTKKVVRLLDTDSIYGIYSDNSSTSRWWSVDPLADQFHSWSPYNFVYNNPINFVDPDGRAPMDDYQVNKQTGMIFLIKKTDDDHDVLYASKDNGKVEKDKSITVEKGVLDNIQNDVVKAEGMETGYSSMETSEAHGSNLFEFLASNTDIEWGISKFEDGSNIITTSREQGREIGGTGIFLNDPSLFERGLKEKAHSHPNGIEYPSGRVPEGVDVDRGGDVSAAKFIEGKNPNRVVMFNIYTPNNGKYHPYNGNTKQPEMPGIILPPGKRKKN